DLEHGAGGHAGAAAGAAHGHGHGQQGEGGGGQDADDGEHAVDARRSGHAGGSLGSSAAPPGARETAAPWRRVSPRDLAQPSRSPMALSRWTLLRVMVCMISRSISLARRRRLLTVPDGISSTVATSVADMLSQ